MTKNREPSRQSRDRQMVDGYKSMGRSVFEVKSGVHGARSLQTAILQIAYVLDAQTELTGHLVLVDPRLSKERRKSSRGGAGVPPTFFPPLQGWISSP